MGQIAISAAFAAGGAVGGFFLGGGPQGAILGASLGWSVGSAVAGVVYGARGLDKQGLGAQIGDLTVQSAAYGAAIPIVYGRVQVAGNIFWATRIFEKGQPQPAGFGGAAPTNSGKGGLSQNPGDPVYVCSFAILLGRGPIADVLRIFADGKLIYDVSSSTSNVPPHFANLITIYKGTPDQEPDPTIEISEGAGNVPRFKHSVYLVFKSFPLTDFGNRIPNIVAEVVTSSAANYARRETSITSGTVTEDNFVISKINPYLYLLTSDGWLWKVDTTGSGTPTTPLFRNVVSAVEAISGIGATVTVGGRLFLDEATDNIIIPFQKSSRSFLVEFNADTFSPVRNNWLNNKALAATSKEVDGLVLGSGGETKYYVVEETNGARLRRYSRLGGFGREFTLEGPAASAKPGNIAAWQAKSRLYYISYEDAEADRFYISEYRINFDTLVHYEINGYGRCRWCMVDESERCLIVGGDDSASAYLHKFDLSTSGNVSGGSPTPSASVEDRSDLYSRALFVSQRKITARKFYSKFNDVLYKISTDDLSDLKTYDSANWSDMAPLNGAAFDEDRNSVWVADTGGSLKEMILDRITANTIDVADVIADICDRAGLDVADYDVSGVTQTLSGYAIPRQITARAALEPLVSGLLLDSVESSGVLKFFERKTSSDATILEADLGARSEEDEPPSKLTETIVQEAEVPQRVIFGYIEPLRDFELGTQKAERRADIVSSRSQLQIEVPIVLSKTRAKELAERHLYTAWTERRTVAFTVGAQWLKLDPGDVVTLTAGAATYTLRIVQIEDGANYIREIKAVVMSAQVATGSGTEGAEGPDVEQEIKPRLPSISHALDIAIVDILHDNEGYYWGAAPVSAAGGGLWDGAALHRSLDDYSFARVAITRSAATVGTVETEFTDEEAEAPYTVMDTTTTITVRLNYGSLSSITLAELLQGSNLAVWGDELIQFQTATDEGNGVYTLSNLLRGRFGTEDQLFVHPVGDRFVLMDRSTIKRIVPSITDRDAVRSFRAATLGQGIVQARRSDFTNTARGLKPYAVCKLVGSFPSSDLHLAWKRRARGGGFMANGVGVPLNELTEAYEVDILDGEGGEVVRTISISGRPSTSGVDLEVSADLGDGTHTITRASGSFLSDGYTVGMYVTSSGFTDSANNAQGSKVTDVQDLTLTVLPLSPFAAEGSGSSKSLEASTAGTRYTAAQQTADFGSYQSTYYVVVYQLSDRVGRGLPNAASFPNTSL